jgi:hypothetical protein
MALVERWPGFVFRASPKRRNDPLFRADQRKKQFFPNGKKVTGV